MGAIREQSSIQEQCVHALACKASVSPVIITIDQRSLLFTVIVAVRFLQLHCFLLRYFPVLAFIELLVEVAARAVSSFDCTLISGVWKNISRRERTSQYATTSFRSLMCLGHMIWRRACRWYSRHVHKPSDPHNTSI